MPNPSIVLWVSGGKHVINVTPVSMEPVEISKTRDQSSLFGWFLNILVNN